MDLVLTLSTKASMRVSFFREQAIHLFFWEEPLPKGGIRSLAASTSPIIALDRWTENNPSQDVIIPRLHKNNANNANNRVASTWWLRNGSFLRLKNIEFGYQLPKKFMDKIGFEAARIYIMGYNLAVWDDIKYFDPEAGNANAGLNYPLPRTFTLGLDFTF